MPLQAAVYQCEQMYRLIEDSDLERYHDAGIGKIEAFYQHELANWKLLAENVASLGKALSRKIEVAGSPVIVQFNPKRMRSVAADLSPQAVAGRPCVLCPAGMPREQRAFELITGYYLLANPFPIFPSHFTIVFESHSPQKVEEHLEAFVQLCAVMGKGYAVFFNGASAGASSPDHMHFQACNRRSLPLLESIGLGVLDSGMRLFEFAGQTILSATSDRAGMADLLHRILESYTSSSTDALALINLIGFEHEGGSTALCCFRRKHRPDCYYAEGTERFIVSPAAVELAGVMVCPRIEDFERLDSKMLKEIYEEVCLDKSFVYKLLSEVLVAAV